MTTSRTAPRRSKASIARRPLTWREVLHTAEWTRTASGVYTNNADGRTVRYVGNGFIRYTAEGERITPRLVVEDWEKVRDWATA